MHSDQRCRQAGYTDTCIAQLPCHSSVGRNTVHAACLVLATEERRLHTAMIEGTTRPLRHMHGLTLTTLAEGPEATACLYASWASGSWLQPLVAIFQLMHDLELMSKCGFTVDMEHMPLEAAAGAVWALTSSKVRGRSLSACWARQGSFHLLVSRGPCNTRQSSKTASPRPGGGSLSRWCGHGAGPCAGTPSAFLAFWQASCTPTEVSKSGLGPDSRGGMRQWRQPWGSDNLFPFGLLAVALWCPGLGSSDWHQCCPAQLRQTWQQSCRA